MSELERRLLAKFIDPAAVAEAWEAGVRSAALFEEPLYQAVFNFTVEYWESSHREAAPTAWALAQE